MISNLTGRAPRRLLPRLEETRSRFSGALLPGYTRFIRHLGCEYLIGGFVLKLERVEYGECVKFTLRSERVEPEEKDYPGWGEVDMTRRGFLGLLLGLPFLLAAAKRRQLYPSQRLYPSGKKLYPRE